MALIPLDQKFHTIDNSVVTQKRGSALVNSQKEIFVTQDIIDTVSVNMSIPVLNTYPVTTPASAGTKFWYQGNEWHYMTQAEIDSTGWTGLVSVGFPAPVSKNFNLFILYNGNNLLSQEIYGTLSPSPPNTNCFEGKTITFDFLGYGIPQRVFEIYSLVGTLGNEINLTIKNAALATALKDTGTGKAVTIKFTNLTAQALNDFFTDLPLTTVTATLDIQNNTGSATCTPSIATSKGYTVIV
jgi:hypothetical protein